ncbi:hypothetical protein HYY71_03365 [Candidatus Woesearchaeota archaeon]|nr:hypothetical protein [Candidatus Woesearchaeota archaeon]
MAESTNPMITGSTVQMFVENTITQIYKGTPKGYAIRGQIEFDLSLIQKDEGGGKLDLKVVGIGGEISKEQSHRVKFSISPTDEAEEAEKQARIAKAQQEEERAKRNLKALQESNNPRKEVSGVRYSRPSDAFR